MTNARKMRLQNMGSKLVELLFKKNFGMIPSNILHSRTMVDDSIK